MNHTELTPEEPIKVKDGEQSSEYLHNPSDMQWPFLFLVLSIVVGVAGCVLSRQDAEIVGGDAYNYIIGSGRGTAIVCLGIVFGLASVTLAINNLINVILRSNIYRK